MPQHRAMKTLVEFYQNLGWALSLLVMVAFLLAGTVKGVIGLGLPDKPRSLNREQARSHKECVFCLLPDKRLALCIAHFQAHGHAPA